MRKFDFYTFSYRGLVVVAAFLFWVALFLFLRWIWFSEMTRPIETDEIEMYKDWRPNNDQSWIEKYIRED